MAIPSTSSDVARIVDGPPPPARYVWLGTGPGGTGARGSPEAGEFPAVTIAVTKKPGENAVDVADRLVARVAELRTP